jgi:hypothetical protein
VVKRGAAAWLPSTMGNNAYPVRKEAMWNSGQASVSVTTISSCGAYDLERMDRSAIAVDSLSVPQGNRRATFVCIRAAVAR